MIQNVQRVIANVEHALLVRLPPAQLARQETISQVPHAPTIVELFFSEVMQMQSIPFVHHATKTVIDAKQIRTPTANNATRVISFQKALVIRIA
jgi:hypothetical protein